MKLEVFIPWIAGVVGVPVVNWLKQRFNLQGRGAVILTVAVSVLLAVAALLFTGGFSGENVLANAAIVFSTATLIYKLLLA